MHEMMPDYTRLFLTMLRVYVRKPGLYLGFVESTSAEIAAIYKLWRCIVRERMRDRLLDSLEDTSYRRFLVYVMGPYKSHVTEDEERYSSLETIRDDLRREGFNAFLATDPEIPLDEMDAGTQTLEFARASNVVVFVVPHDGKNLGVGIEVGAVLEDMTDLQRERIVFLHEEGMRSAMIGTIGDRWNVERRTFADEDELLEAVKVFIAEVVRKEDTGELPFPPGKPDDA